MPTTCIPHIQHACVLIMLQMSADSCLSGTLEQGANTRPWKSQIIWNRSGKSGQLYEIRRELMGWDLSNSTTVSKEQFRQLCDCHCLRLWNDQVKPENVFTVYIPVIYNLEETLLIKKAHFQQLSQCFQAETTHTGISPWLQMRRWIWIILHLPVPFFLGWCVFFIILIKI